MLFRSTYFVGGIVGIFPAVDFGHQRHHHQLDEIFNLLRRLVKAQFVEHQHGYFVDRHHPDFRHVAGQILAKPADGEYPARFEFAHYAVEHRSRRAGRFIGVNRPTAGGNRFDRIVGIRRRARCRYRFRSAESRQQLHIGLFDFGQPLHPTGLRDRKSVV